MSERLTGRRTTIFLLFLAHFLGFLALYSRFSSIPDSDSYYHLAVARLYVSDGFVGSLDWTRFSVFATALGDKELLFHVLLMPFVALFPGAVGGRIALALLCAVIATMVARIAMDLSGRGFAVLAIVAFVGSPFFYARVFRLRPELLALILLLAGLELLARRKMFSLAAVSALFALSYTAFHILPALVTGVCILRWLRERVNDWKLVLGSIAGTIAGVLVHPHFPDNIGVWLLQNIAFFRLKDSLDVGLEITRPSLSGSLLLNIGFWLAILALLGLTSRAESAERDETAMRLAESFGVAAIFFLLLFTQMERMVTYFVPFTLIAVVAWLVARGRDASTARIAGRTIPIAIILLVCSLTGLPRFLDFTSRVTSSESGEAPWKEIGAMIPAEATVAAHWGPTGFLVFFADQGRYLNVLDPLFMFEANPSIYHAQRALFGGSAPDVPLVAATTLSSAFVFADELDSSAGLLLARRLARDPRISARSVDGLILARIRHDANEVFVLDWHAEDGRTYPRDQQGEGVEGFVDAARIGGSDQCVTFTSHVEIELESELLSLEFSPYGPATLSINDEVLIRSGGTLAIIADASGVARRLEAGSHEFVVETCPDPSSRINGFYLIRRN